MCMTSIEGLLPLNPPTLTSRHRPIKQTYGLVAYFLVHPVPRSRAGPADHRHWQDVPGQEQNDFRRSALSIVRVVASLEEVVAQVAAEQGAHRCRGDIGGDGGRFSPGKTIEQRLSRSQRYTPAPAALFGTGWGLTKR